MKVKKVVIVKPSSLPAMQIRINKQNLCISRLDFGLLTHLFKIFSEVLFAGYASAIRLW